MTRYLVALLSVLMGPAAAAASPELAFPLDCIPGETCWIAQYMDHDPGPEARDFGCGPMTYDGHKGTDFAIRDLAAMRQGVLVLAPAAGTVVGTRDGMADVDVTTIGGRATLKGNDCGNGVRIDHGDGWFTQSCHLRRGSVTVRTGDVVAAGQKLGLVGMSGDAQFPHVHIEVTNDGRAVDPFLGPTTAGAAATCKVGAAALWREDVMARLPYQGVALYNAGFSQVPPDPTAVRGGSAGETQLPRTAPAIILWVDIFGTRKGDEIVFTIHGPDRLEILHHASREEKNRARRFLLAGRKRKGQDWPPGVYRGQVVLERDGVRHTLVREVTVR